MRQAMSDMQKVKLVRKMWLENGRVWDKTFETSVASTFLWTAYQQPNNSWYVLGIPEY
jgi:hypothetical protein